MASEEPVRIARKMGIVRIHRLWELMDGNSRSALRVKSGPAFGCGAETSVRRAGWVRSVTFSSADGENRRLRAWRREYIVGLVFLVRIVLNSRARRGEGQVRQGKGSSRNVDIT